MKVYLSQTRARNQKADRHHHLMKIQKIRISILAHKLQMTNDFLVIGSRHWDQRKRFTN